MLSTSRYIHFVIIGLGLVGLFLFLKWFLDSALNVLLLLVFAGILFGFLGLLLATPLTACVLVLVKMLYVEDVLGDSTDVQSADGSNN